MKRSGLSNPDKHTGTPGQRTRVAIVGDGPAGCTLAALLARKGIDVAVFASGKRPSLVVGESLIPAIIPVFRRLGIEDEVAAIGQRKPGGTFVWRADCPIELSFDAIEGLLPAYAYNCPRPALDEIIARCARRSGARWIAEPAKVRPGDPARGENEVVLEPECLRAIPDWRSEQPDLLVDSSGRRRTLVRLLGIAADEGPRKDIAHFAHYDRWEHAAPPGQIMIGRMACGGWSWRIPLKASMSVGIVVPADCARELGSSPAERLERAIDLDPDLAATGRHRRRLSEVPTYNNYQLITHRGHGTGWAAAGDAFGFVDPMLSPGMWIAMRSGEMLADGIPQAPPPARDWESGLRQYERRMKALLAAWQELVAFFYDGSIIASYYGGRQFMLKHRNPLVDRMEKHIQRNLAGMACGALTERPYSRRLLRFICRHGHYGVARGEMAVG